MSLFDGIDDGLCVLAMMTVAAWVAAKVAAMGKMKETVVSEHDG